MQTVVLGVRRLAARRAACGAAAASLLGPQSWSVPSRLGVSPQPAHGPDCLPQAGGSISSLRRAGRSAQINRPGPSGPRQIGTSQSVCSPCWPDWRGRLPNCLPPSGPAADHPYFLFLEFNKKSTRHFALFLASTPYSSELFLVSRSLFHFFDFTLNTVGIPALYSVGIPIAIL